MVVTEMRGRCLMYKSIVVGVDMAQLDRAERVLQKARTLLDTGGKIVLVNVLEELPAYLSIDIPQDLMGQARSDATRTLLDLRQKFGLDASIDIRQGSPAHEILACARANAADLIILASHVPDLSNYFIGATADRVVRHAECSVLVDR